MAFLSALISFGLTVSPQTMQVNSGGNALLIVFPISVLDTLLHAVSFLDA